MTALSALGNPFQLEQPQTQAQARREETEAEQIEFLDILITQLLNQNPLDPVDTNEFTNQLILQTQLEEQMEINDGIQNLVDTTAANTNVAALNYLGQTAEIDSNAAPVQNGVVQWAYNTQGVASEIEIEITNEEGEVLFEGEGNVDEGVQIFQLTTGFGFEDQPLFMTVRAFDNNGNAIDTDISGFAVVDSVSTEGNDTFLNAGGVAFTPVNILKLNETPQGPIQVVDVTDQFIIDDAANGADTGGENSDSNDNSNTGDEQGSTSNDSTDGSGSQDTASSDTGGDGTDANDTSGTDNLNG